MKLRLFSGLIVLASMAATARAQQPQGVAQVLQGMASQPASHAAITFDRDMLAQADSFMGGHVASAGLSSITVENYRYNEPAFYLPESMASLVAAYNAAGWQHLVNGHAGPAEQASPTKPLTDLWLHYHGTTIDDVTVLLRGPRQMSVIEVSGTLRPLDLVHLSGHFGIPKVDPDAVMVPAPRGK